MTELCLITGTVHDRAGNIVASTDITVTSRQRVVSAGVLLVPSVEVFSTNALGEVEMELYPGYYTAELMYEGKLNRFAMCVPSKATASFNEVVNNNVIITGIVQGPIGPRGLPGPQGPAGTTSGIVIDSNNNMTVPGYVEVVGEGSNGTTRFSQSFGIGRIDVDPESLDDNSRLSFFLDGNEAATMDRFGHLRLGDGGDPTVTLELAGTDALLLPVGTTAQAPAATAGRLRYNSTLGALTFANGTVHKVLSSGWELFETAYDFAVDGAVASVLANGWEDGWDYAVVAENLTFATATFLEVAFEFEGAALTGYIDVGLVAATDTAAFFFYAEIPQARVARNVWGIRYISRRDDDAINTDTIGNVTGSGNYIGITRAAAQKMSGISLIADNGANIDGGVVRIYRKRNAL